MVCDVMICAFGIYNYSNVGMPIDIWSFGCILYEIRTASTLFCGENELDQLGAIAEVIGQPSKEFLYRSRKTQCYDSEMGVLKTVDSGGKTRKIGHLSLDRLLPRRSDKDFKMFLHSILQWVPERRPLPGEAANHQWMTESDTDVAI
jgi:serine/threonine protein kinase